MVSNEDQGDGKALADQLVHAIEQRVQERRTPDAHSTGVEVKGVLGTLRSRLDERVAPVMAACNQKAAGIAGSPRHHSSSCP